MFVAVLYFIFSLLHFSTALPTNLRMLHELTTTQFNTIQFLQHLKLLPTKPSDKDSCKQTCDNWYRAHLGNRGDEGMFFRILDQMVICFYRLYFPMSHVQKY